MEYAPKTLVFLLLNVLLEALLLGGFGALICLIIWMLISKQSQLRTTQKVLFCISVSMFLLACAHIGLLVHQLVHAPNIPAFNVRAQVVLWAMTLALGDSILIWRVWTIWDRNHLIVFVPISLTIATTVLTLREAIRYKTGGFFVLNTDPPIALSAANTSLCTILIAARIWYLRHRIRKLAGSTGTSLGQGLMGGVLWLIETGALFTSTQILVLIFKPLKNKDAFSIIMNLEIPMMGVLPTLLVVLVYLRKLERPSSAWTGHTHDHDRTETTLRFESRSPINKDVLGPNLHPHDHSFDGSSSITRVHSGCENEAEMV